MAQFVPPEANIQAAPAIRNGPSPMKGWKFLLLTAGIFVGVILLGIVLLVLDFWVKRPIVLWAGSYNGRVTDGATGAPLEGAAVYMSWTAARRLNPLEHLFMWDRYRDHEFVWEALVYTDAQGYYRAPEENIYRWFRIRTGSPEVKVVVYKKGYVAYASDAVFDGKNTIDAPRDYFRKKGNVVSLLKWKNNYSPEFHYYFIKRRIIGNDKKISNAILNMADWEKW